MPAIALGAPVPAHAASEAISARLIPQCGEGPQASVLLEIDSIPAGEELLFGVAGQPEVLVQPQFPFTRSPFGTSGAQSGDVGTLLVFMTTPFFTPGFATLSISGSQGTPIVGVTSVTMRFTPAGGVYTCTVD